MNLDRFLGERQGSWAELEQLVASARGKPERLGPGGVRRLGALYRSAAADLALARRRFPGDPVVARLEDLVARARHLVYDAPGRRGSLASFFGRRYWRRVRERPVVLAAALVLLLVPAALSVLWALRDPAAAAGVVPGPFRAVTEPRSGGTDLGLGSSEAAAFAGAVLTNNIRVTLLAFAGGVTLGLLTGGVLVFNGVLLGTLLGLATGAGNGRSFLELVTPHGVLELSCVAVAGAAGLRLGWGIVDPGRRRRSEAMQAEGRAAVELALGTAPWLVVAGLVEGFVTPAGYGLATSVAVGLGLGALYWALVWLRGGPVPSS